VKGGGWEPHTDIVVANPGVLSFNRIHIFRSEQDESVIVSAHETGRLVELYLRIGGALDTFIANQTKVTAMGGEVLIVDSEAQKTVLPSNFELGVDEGMISELAIHVGSGGIEDKKNGSITKLVNRAIADSKVGPDNSVGGRLK